MKKSKKIGVILSSLLFAGTFALGGVTMPASAETVTDGTLTLTNTGSWPGGLGRHNVHHKTYVEVADTEDLVIEYELLSATEDMARFGMVKGLQDVADEMDNYDAYTEMAMHNGKTQLAPGFLMASQTELATYSKRSAAVQEYMYTNQAGSWNGSEAAYGLYYHTSGWGANLGSKQGFATTNVKYKYIYGADGHYELWIYNTAYPDGKKVMYTAPTFASSANQLSTLTIPDSLKQNDEKIFVNRSGYIGFWANHSTYNLEIDNFKVSVIDANGNETVKINETYDYTTGGSEYDTSNWVYTKSGSSTWNCELPEEEPEELIYAEANTLAIQSGMNHADYQGQKMLVIYARNGETSNALDYTYPEGNFASSLLLNGEATDKFTFKSSGGHSASGSSPIHLTYANDDTLFATTSESYLTLTIPQGTTLYNIKFTQDLSLYFYNGAWQLTEPVIVTEYKSANGVLVQANNNHLDKWGHKYSLLQFTKDGTAVAMDKTVDIGNFFENATIEINGTTTSIADSQFTFQKENQGHGDTYFDVLYALNGSWVDPAEGEMYTLTIPVGTTAYDVKFETETKLYFYNGAWQTEPMPEELVYAETNALAIQGGMNHAADNSLSGNMMLVLYAYDASNSSIKLDYSYPEGNFNANLLLNEEATDKFTFKSSGGHSASGSSPIHLTYANDDTLFATTSESYLTLTIPQGTMLYNVKFTQDLSLYFYNGAWQLTEPAIVTEYQMVDGVGLLSYYNHVDKWGHKNTLWQFTKDGTVVVMDKAVDVGNFFENATIEINDVTTSLKDSQFTFQKNDAGHGNEYFEMLYGLNGVWVNPAMGDFYTVTIPAGTTVHDCKFETEVKLYFFEGVWTTMQPIPETEKVYVDTDKVYIEGNFNHEVYNGKMALIIYSYSTENVSTKLNFAYGVGSFNENIYLTEYKDGVEGAKIEGKIRYTAGTHSLDGNSPIHLEYDVDDDFWASTIEKYYILTIPAGTTLYNVKFQNETKLYFYDGKWVTAKPLAENEMEFLEVDTLRINPSFNHIVYKDMNALIFHGFSVDNKQTSLVPNKVYPTGDFISKIALYDKNGQKVNVEFILGTTMGHMGETSSAIHLAYATDEDFWVKTLDNYYELRIEEGAKLFNLVMGKSFSYYFYNGVWMENKPVVDYSVSLDNLPTYTIGEIVEAKPGKLDKFVLGELGNENVVAGSFSSPILNAKEYNLHFKMKMLSDEYRIAFTLNSSVSNLWGGLVLNFQRMKEGDTYNQGVHYLDYLNVNGSFLGAGGDYYLTDNWFEMGEEYDVKITVALDKNGKGVLLMLTVDGEEWGRLFVPPTGDYTMEEVMSNGFLLMVDSGDGSYFGEVEFTNIDVNPPVLNVNNAEIESGYQAEGYEYDVEVTDGLEGVISYEATIISGELDNGKFVAGTTYIVRFTAQDKVGNIMTQDIEFTCVYDKTAPVITFSDKVVDGTIRVALGTTEEELKNLISAVATDDKDGNVAVTYTFPEGMFDADGKLTEGNFRVPVTAKDSSNNEITITVRVRAMEAEEPGENPGETSDETPDQSSNQDPMLNPIGCNLGCNGVMTGGASLAIAVAAGVLLLKKRKED